MPKKIRNHLLNFLNVTGVYVAVLAGIAVHHLLMGLITDADGDQTIERVVSLIYFVICVWFGWRFYTGVYRDGDFLD